MSRRGEGKSQETTNTDMIAENLLERGEKDGALPSDTVDVNTSHCNSGGPSIRNAAQVQCSGDFLQAVCEDGRVGHNVIYQPESRWYGVAEECDRGHHFASCHCF